MGGAPMAEPVSVEKQAVRLADVYTRAYDAAHYALNQRRPPAVATAAHEIAMLLVQRVLNQEIGPCR